MDLFAHASGSVGAPLADLLRPQELDQIVGQDRTIGPASAMGRLLRKGQIPSLILWGPPGTGKTTFALALARQSGSHFVLLNAVEAGTKALREAGEEGRQRRLIHQQKTVLFVDEIHRFNKGQQDVLLPYLEKGDLILIGATTENPSYELNRALLSRCRVIVFERLSKEDLRSLAVKAGAHLGRSLESWVSTEALEWLLDASDGDGRRLLNSLEVLWPLVRDGQAVLDLAEVREVLQRTPIAHDKSSEMHYDLISAFIKSVRGTDPDAAVYYLARILEGGEDPVFLARRLIILASEDIGNADPRALPLAIAGLQAVEAIGLPEAAITLSQVTTYLASCPKSNRSYVALQRAQELVRGTLSVPVPLHLRSSKTELSKQLGYGRGYRYPHDDAAAFAEQKYLPEEVQLERPLYEPSSSGFEKNLAEHLAWRKKTRRPGVGEKDPASEG